MDRKALEFEARAIKQFYESELRQLADRVKNAQERLKNSEDGSKLSAISDHDSHNMASNLHGMAVLAGRFKLVEALLREAK
jgi:uncharacterized protein (DUF2249 family)